MYTIQKHPFDYTTGVDKHGNQILVGLIYPYVVAVFFDVHGTFLELRIKLVNFPARSIHKNGPYMIEETEFSTKLNNQIENWLNKLDFHERPIHINKFLLKEFNVGIEDLPRHFIEFQEDQSDFTEEEQREYPKLIVDWKTERNFVLWWGKDYYINKEGDSI